MQNETGTLLVAPGGVLSRGQHGGGSRDLWNRMTTQKLVLTEKEYASLMACAVQLGHSDLFERFLSGLSEDVLIPAKETVSTIVSWFQSRHAAATSTTLTVQPPAVNSTVPIQPMGPVTTARTGWTVDMGCRIDEATGTLTTGCLKGSTLQPVLLSALASDQLLQFNQDIVLQGTVDGHDSKFQGGCPLQRSMRATGTSFSSFCRKSMVPMIWMLSWTAPTLDITKLFERPPTCRLSSN